MSKEPKKSLRVKDLLEFGIPRACYCRTDENLEIKPDKIHYFITTGLKNAYNDEVIKKFIDFFGKNEVINSIDKCKEYISKRFYTDIMKDIQNITVEKIA